MEITVNFTNPDQDYAIDVVEIYEDGDWVATVKADDIVDGLEALLEDDFSHVTGVEDGKDYKKAIAVKAALGWFKEKMNDL